MSKEQGKKSKLTDEQYLSQQMYSALDSAESIGLKVGRKIGRFFKRTTNVTRIILFGCTFLLWGFILGLINYNKRHH